MKGCYGIVNGKNYFIDDKLIEKTISNGVANGIVKGSCKLCMASFAIGGLAIIGAGVYQGIRQWMEENEKETNSE